jgi:hypothetical protein
MQISQVSNVNPVYDNTAAPAPKSSSSSAPVDTVHLSAAAKAQLAGHDADGDNDGH